ncbi:hypothetical protein EVAR_72017_1 [Eumeta japonica]|uniref:Uncharacterized protein n=1 Tax=Eumeta variegata TaxID=151549 RepID=A0A4C1TK60_EUMVA|nr:hypothetical protein EVAR_72017_1 [Eumeta japonica]
MLKKEIESTTADASKNDTLGANIQQRLSSKLAWRFAVNNTEVHHISALMAGLSTRLARTHDEIASESDPKLGCHIQFDEPMKLGECPYKIGEVAYAR